MNRDEVMQRFGGSEDTVAVFWLTEADGLVFDTILYFSKPWSPCRVVFRSSDDMIEYSIDNCQLLVCERPTDHSCQSLQQSEHHHKHCYERLDLVSKMHTKYKRWR